MVKGLKALDKFSLHILFLVVYIASINVNQQLAEVSKRQMHSNSEKSEMETKAIVYIEYKCTYTNNGKKNTKDVLFICNVF